MTENILQKIVADKRTEVEALKAERGFEAWLEAASACPNTRDFKAVLRHPEKITLIAELKKASPSKGILREEFNPVEIAASYRKGGAAALSVLTEDLHFQGDRSYLNLVRETVDLPLLRKDFIFDEFQIPESRLLGADAILLIAGLLSEQEMRHLLEIAAELGLDVLCEVHDAQEMKKAVGVGADLIGINNRDLTTFEVDLQTTFDLVPLAPEGAILVSESGIRGWADLEILRDAGVDAVLVGETLIRQEDMVQAIRNLYNPRAPVPLGDP